MQLLEQVLARLDKAILKLKKDKCEFLVCSVTYLGHKIDAEGLHPIEEKVNAVKDAPVPNNVHQLKA